VFSLASALRRRPLRALPPSPHHLFLLALAAIASVLPASRAAAEPPPYCTKAMLDIRVLPPLEPDSPEKIRALVVEIENRSDFTCQFSGYAHSGASPSTPAEMDFASRKSILPPGGMAHFVVAWKEKASLLMSQCRNQDAFIYSPGPSGPNDSPALTVNHLWMHLCDGPYISPFRSGPFAGEPIAEDWLKRLGASASDFAAPRFATGAPSVERPVALSIRPVRHMLGTFLPLYADLPRINYDCPYVLLRKREVDGSTTIYVDHCKTASAPEGIPHGMQTFPWSPELGLSLLGLQPAQLGAVEFEIVARIIEDGQPVFATARTEVRLWDPTPPPLPAVDSDLPLCQAPQLRASLATAFQHGKWLDAHVYEAENVSAVACRVGSVPQIQFVHPTDHSHVAEATVCPNCSNSLFEPRPNGWIDLPAGATAHFIVAATRFNLDEGRWRLFCDDAETLSLKMPGENPSISLPFGSGACAEVTVSSWRAGKYDDDPMNLAFEKASVSREISKPVPGRCSAADFKVLGKPIMLEESVNSLQFGLSLASAKFVWHQSVPLHLWIDNPTDTDHSVMTCSTLDYFWSGGFDLYDAYGHRLLRKFEVEQRNRQELQKNNSFTALGCMMICSANGPLTIPARSCRNGTEPGLAYHFNRDLAQMYDLPPGTYYVVPSARKNDGQGCRKPPSTLDPSSFTGYLKISIEEN